MNAKGESFPLWINKHDSEAVQINASESNGSGKGSRSAFVDKAKVIKVGNELEFLTRSDKIDDETAMSLWHLNLKLLLATLGDKGCNYYTKACAYLTKS
ncbi:fructokinase-2 [Tanacetum coccineum]